MLKLYFSAPGRIEHQLWVSREFDQAFKLKTWFYVLYIYMGLTASVILPRSLAVTVVLYQNISARLHLQLLLRFWVRFSNLVPRVFVVTISFFWGRSKISIQDEVLISVRIRSAVQDFASSFFLQRVAISCCVLARHLKI
jgi:hypothetical protein